ncbi:lipid-A-disaccharide synthase [Candidatus Blochmanniella vafra str. BVAF]|uniref:Lipid-A-disaccharide synthase n=1 Tax=Blochmanniella vafra (strain BVAF) TaxID=859654 RepID=E8Q6T8_BLOVB|nr:lipid-A-disaccharide synthase [Candidatus Blochmannia vafer]ADV33685.1 lipid-A-disaccharide synthase [Candidatus Blochmannia vafer str. BVAF]
MVNCRPILIGMVAGENSGDILGVGLIKSLKKYLKNVYFFGVGGMRMRSENMECWYNIEELSVMGITEVIFKLPSLIRIRRNLISQFLKLKLDIFIGIDFPDFNISLEYNLKKKGIRTIHYVSPSVWAWRRNRILYLKKAVHSVLLLFPFEKPIYSYFNVPHKFIGHVLADEIPLYPNKIKIREKLGISDKKICLAVLPGSRMEEIKMLAQDFLTCIELLNNNIPNLEVLVPLHHQKLIDQFVKLSSSISVKVKVLHTQKAWKIMVAADIALLTAGTATLECMLAKCPMVVAYRTNLLTFTLVKNFIKIPWISLPNLIAKKSIVQEFIQKECNPKNLSIALLNLLNYNDDQLLTLKRIFYQLHQSIKLNANEKAAYEILKFIKS